VVHVDENEQNPPPAVPLTPHVVDDVRDSVAEQDKIITTRTAGIFDG
jgi:hypothetical protein